MESGPTGPCRRLSKGVRKFAHGFQLLGIRLASTLFLEVFSLKQAFGLCCEARALLEALGSVSPVPKPMAEASPGERQPKSGAAREGGASGEELLALPHLLPVLPVAAAIAAVGTRQARELAQKSFEEAQQISTVMACHTTRTFLLVRPQSEAVPVEICS